jgi:hypothetical protein
MKSRKCGGKNIKKKAPLPMMEPFVILTKRETLYYKIGKKKWGQVRF